MAQKYTEPVVKKIVEVDTNHEYSLIHIDLVGKKDEKTGKTKKREMTVKHNNCGYTYTLDIYEFCSYGKRRCRDCRGIRSSEKTSENIEVIKRKTEILTDSAYNFVDERYTNSKTKHIFLHNTCGTKFKKTWDKFSAGQRCTECYRKGMESFASRYVRDVLDHLFIAYECEKRFDDCTNPKSSKTLPFDYYIPEINTLIEIDGEQHERGSFTKYDYEGTAERDIIKNLYAEEKEIELVRIPAKKWSQLPEILHAILSKELLRSLSTEEVKAIPQSTHPERINKDLQKLHNGEYGLHDLYYFGVDRPHTFIHYECGTLFKKTLSTVRLEAMPCPHCKKKIREKKQHISCDEKLIEKTNGRYSLDKSHVGRTRDNKRLVHCHACSESWYSLVGNIMCNNGGCPSCNKKNRAKSA